MPINGHHLVAAALGDPYRKPTIGATIAVTTVATAVLLSAVAKSFVRSLWIRLMRVYHAPYIGSIHFTTSGFSAGGS